jgi:hypothetical protein
MNFPIASKVATKIQYNINICLYLSILQRLDFYERYVCCGSYITTLGCGTNHPIIVSCMFGKVCEYLTIV